MGNKLVSDRLSGGNMCMSASGLAAGTTNTTSTGALVIALYGRSYSVAAGANAATPTTDHVTGKAFEPVTAGKACVFVVAYDKAGNRRMVQGPMVGESDFASGAGGAEFPVVPDELCPVGYILSRAGATAVGNWVAGTNNWAGVTGVTNTFVPCHWLPSKPVYKAD